MSSGRPKITVLIPCKDEERHLAACIDSVSWCDEILVADSGSTDKSKAIAQEKGARIIEREYIHSANFKNWAIPQCTHEWVLIIDSDERVTPELRAEIEATLSADPAAFADMYAIGRINHFMGQRINHCGWETDTVNRLFKRDRCEYPNLAVHADLQFKANLATPGRAGKLRAKFLHYTYYSFDQYLKNKFVPYTTRSAEDLIGKGRRRASWLNLFFRPPIRFIKMYFLRLGFLDGKAGLILCTLASFWVFMKYAKLWGMLEAPEKTPLSPRSTLPPDVIAEIRAIQST
ncbi:MAG TPA: glycosyltransferase family 2 protein [Planctomycetota bacterium]|nr:glycosyltransferase family 2 protein [Planctomycetota bacterium]